MSTEDNKRLSRRFFEKAVTKRNDELFTASGQKALERKIFGLALTLATEPSKLGQLRQMLVHLQEQNEIPEEFSTWAIRHIDEKVMAMALEYAHDAEVIIQILSFRGGALESLLHTLEDMYRYEQITQRVYVKAKLLLSGAITGMPGSERSQSKS